MKYVLHFLLFFTCAFGQPATITSSVFEVPAGTQNGHIVETDSLLFNVLQSYQTQKTDHNDWKTLDLLDSISGWFYTAENFPQAIHYLELQDSLVRVLLEKSPEVLQKINLDDLQKKTSFRLVHSYFEAGHYRKALNISVRLIEKSSSNLTDEELLKAQSWTGLFYYYTGDYTSALKIDLQALFLAENLKHLSFQSLLLSRIGFIHRDLKNYTQALSFFRRSVKLDRELGDSQGLVTGLNETGNVYLLQAQYDSALYYKQLALNEARLDNYERGISFVTNDIALTYRLQGNTETALEYFMRSLVYLRNNNNQRDLVITLMNIGEAKMSIQQYADARAIFTEALNIAKHSGLREYIATIYRNLAYLHEGQNQFELAYDYLYRSKELSDSLLNSEKLSTLAEIQSGYEFEKKEQELRLIKKDNEIQSLLLKKAHLWRNFLIFASILMIILAGVLFSLYKTKTKANDAITLQNQKLQDLNLCLDSEIKEKEAAKLKLEKYVNELEAALESIRTLRGLLPICASCKKIRDDDGYWHQVENYICDHSDAEFSHGICPDCMKVLYPEFHKSKSK